MSSILDKAKKALDLVREGREALEAITHEIQDGKHAITATEQAELNSMLEKERPESQAAHDNLQNAINASRAGA